ncbi:acyl-CoA thioesterase [bacterium]|nr:acyl-CoA thioesterase [bacterium]
MTHFSHPMTVKMYDTDAAGIQYFASQFRFAHDAFESLMAHHGLSFHTMISGGDALFVIVHADADYYHSLTVGDPIVIDLHVAHIGTTAFRLHYQVKKDGQLMGQMNTVHVCIHPATRQKQPIPTSIRDLLGQYLDPS